MRRILSIVLVVILMLAVSAAFFLKKKRKTVTGERGKTVELTFELDKKFEFGEYYFDVDNGKGATYPLCFCLTEKNTFPPDCVGDIKYIYRNTPGTMCMPLHIGKGRCTTKLMSTAGFSTMFVIPLEYPWIKPSEKIVVGVKVPEGAKEGSRLVVAVIIYKQGERGQLRLYRNYQEAIIVE